MKRRHLDRRAKHKRTESDDRRAVRKRTSRTALADRLVSSDPVNFFVDNCEKTVEGWASLLQQTTPRYSTPSTDPRWVSAFETLDSFMTGRQGTPLLRRLAYVQYKRVSDTLEGIVQSERLSGAPRNSGVGDSTIVMNVVGSAQEGPMSAASRRNAARENRRIARRWAALAGPSPLFLLLYTDVAETVV